MALRNILRLAISLIAVLGVAAACQPTTRTEFLMEVTREVTVVVVVTATPDAAAITSTPSAEAVISEPASVTVPPTATEAATELPTATETPPPTIDVFPTPIVSEIIVAEQLFENGRMFYLQPLDIIWVLVNDDEAGTSGTWTFHQDTWEEGMPEIDTILEQEKPEGLYQPERGFGKLWRDNPDIQEALGWAREPEFGHVTRYQYFAGGRVEGGRYIPGPGTHSVNSRYGGTYIFDESDSTWGLASN